MLISASRRTDIPAYYSSWFFNRWKEGYVLVRNARNPKLVSRVSLSPDVVDGVVFWSKNPRPLLNNLTKLGPVPYYIQFTLNGYGSDIERNLPDKRKELIPTFLKLAEKAGPRGVVWRYDPILFSDHYPMDFHLECFSEFASRLRGATDTCVVSFLDVYPSIEKRLKRAGLRAPDLLEEQRLLTGMQKICEENGITLATCSESHQKQVPGVVPNACIDPKRFQAITGVPLDIKKDSAQREACRCAESVDIGMYNSCVNGCVYCYANHDEGLCQKNLAIHDPASPLLYGKLQGFEDVTEREAHSNVIRQMSLFD